MPNINGVTVETQPTAEPFGVVGKIELQDFMFDTSRADFVAGAKLEIELLGRDLFEYVMREYDRRNARSE